MRVGIYFLSLNSATPGRFYISACFLDQTRLAYLALEQLQTGSTTSRDMAQFLLLSGIGNKSSGISTTNNDGRAILDGFDTSLQKGVGTLGESWELEDTGGTVP